MHAGGYIYTEERGGRRGRGGGDGTSILTNRITQREEEARMLKYNTWWYSCICGHLKSSEGPLRSRPIYTCALVFISMCTKMYDFVHLK